jgi:hypothetical protein
MRLPGNHLVCSGCGHKGEFELKFREPPADLKRQREVAEETDRVLNELGLNPFDFDPVYVNIGSGWADGYFDPVDTAYLEKLIQPKSKNRRIFVDLTLDDSADELE